MAPGILNGSPPNAPQNPAVDVEHQLAPVNEDEEQDAVADLTLLRSFPEPPTECQVCVVGAGPAGLMLGATLARYGVAVEVIDDRADQTPVGRADGLQPKTIETFRQLRLSDALLQRGVRVFDISFWRSTAEEPLHRLGREVHYPPVIDVLDPYILLVHQGIVEGLFIDDMRKRGKEVRRNMAFDSYDFPAGKNGQLQVNCRTNVTHDKRTLLTQYLVGCDGAHSKVRKSIPDVEAIGMSQPAIWGVLDGELITDFPDIWSKTLVYSEEHGSILLIPRERNMTRFYIELKSCVGTDRRRLGQTFVMEQARKIMAPYNVDWKYIEWFGRYQVGQRVASRFCDGQTRVFLSGDASHTHSPKAAQGMNTSMHDSWNLSWKLNLAVRGLAKPTLLESYEEERRKIALDLANFDYEHANQLAGGDAVALAKNFKANVRFISGIGAEYSGSSINKDVTEIPFGMGDARPGCLLAPGKVSRYIDSNPVDVQLDIPMLGQFRIFILTWDVQQAAPFLTTFCRAIAESKSFVSQLSAAASVSYAEQPRLGSPEDVYLRPERYTAVSHLFTFALITTMAKTEFEISDLPALLQDSRWTIYLDNVPEQDTRGQQCTDKWLGRLEPGEVAILNVRPDGYVGSVNRWDTAVDDAGVDAARWLDDYYSGFMQLPATAN
ncbi:FAD binding domain-containingprotein [Purpureocillium lilacinum]|uniref:FAD binding domain-containingprotein n=1 Tax=Purpureocillium lilacinum TaxID=33203 RepID=A0A179HLN4_PURLI|nr:FAD binding domain-containingprotein [Purpureocillium lilacinum]OAQ90914.1 FAD binding domain-containingprotein [Purpureocillium lilacinum]